jgi:hypothetical protein
MPSSSLSMQRSPPASTLPMGIYKIVRIRLDFGHSRPNQIAGKWQPAEGLMAGAWKAASFGDVHLLTRLDLISRRPMPALAWSAKG